MKRWSTLFALAIVLGLVIAEGGRLVWVRVNPDTRQLELSNGLPLPENLKKRVVPGQYLALGPGWVGLTRGWRPPNDIVKTFAPKDAGRVVFSHERHFAALGAKAAACTTCHQDLKTGKSWPSKAPKPTLEPHGPKSLGRFCASCHDGKKRIRAIASRIPGASPPLDGTLFPAFGTRGAKSCQRCHAPKNHGKDFTPWHMESAEGGAGRCATCHRGADRITQAEIGKARKFFQSQLTLVQSPENAGAFNATLPNNFCAYCHGIDLRAWYGE